MKHPRFFKRISKLYYTFKYFLVKSLQIELLAQIHYYDPQSTGINLQSPQSDLTPWTLTLPCVPSWSKTLGTQCCHCHPRRIR